jgi:diadenosine tetraphosphate (Ap4A) HIT family hydrolase
MPNQTLEKFGYPSSIVKDYENWVVLLRRPQITLGSLAVVHKQPIVALPDISPEGFCELQKVTLHTETTLRNLFRFDKINYLLLMMVDPDVHFHVIPRYSDVREFSGVEFYDTFWPGPPNVSAAVELPAALMEELRQSLVTAWPE